MVYHLVYDKDKMSIFIMITMAYWILWRCAQCSKLHAPAKFPVNRENNRENKRKLLLCGPQTPIFIGKS